MGRLIVDQVQVMAYWWNVSCQICNHDDDNDDDVVDDHDDDDDWRQRLWWRYEQKQVDFWIFRNNRRQIIFFKFIYRKKYNINNWIVLEITIMKDKYNHSLLYSL